MDKIHLWTKKKFLRTKWGKNENFSVQKGANMKFPCTKWGKNEMSFIKC